MRKNAITADKAVIFKVASVRQVNIFETNLFGYLLALINNYEK